MMNHNDGFIPPLPGANEMVDRLKSALRSEKNAV